MTPPYQGPTFFETKAGKRSVSSLLFVLILAGCLIVSTSAGASPWVWMPMLAIIAVFLAVALISAISAPDEPYEGY